MEQLVSERIRRNLELTEQLRHSRRQRTLHRARPMEHKAQRRMIQARAAPPSSAPGSNPSTTESRRGGLEAARAASG